MPYVVYILQCADGTYYTGVTTDMEQRLEQHNTGERGAKYTKARRPVKLVYQEAAVNRSEAQKREYVVRKLSRTKKQLLIRA